MIYWLSTAVFPARILPLSGLPDLSGLLTGVAPWSRDQVPGMDRSDAEILASIRRELILLALESWAFIAAGVASGVLIARRSRTGRILALMLCAALLAHVVVLQRRMVWAGHAGAFWAVLARRAPLQFVRRVIDSVFYVSTLVYLTRRPVAGRFARSPPARNPATGS